MRQYFGYVPGDENVLKTYPGEAAYDASVLCLESSWSSGLTLPNFALLEALLLYVAELIKSRITACASGITWSLSNNSAIIKFILRSP